MLAQSTKELILSGLAIASVVGVGVSFVKENPLWSSVSTASLAGSIYLIKKGDEAERISQLTDDLKTVEASFEQWKQTALGMEEKLKLYVDPKTNRLLDHVEAFKNRYDLATERDTVQRLTEANQRMSEERDRLSLQLESTQTDVQRFRQMFEELQASKGQEVSRLAAELDTQKVHHLKAFDEMVEDYERQLDEAFQKIQTLEKELFRYRDSNGLVLEVEKQKVQGEVNTLRLRIQELEDLRQRLEGHVKAGRTVVEELEGEFAYLTETAYQEIESLHGEQLSARDKMLLQLDGQLAECLKPQVFDQIGNYQRADKLIEVLHREHQIILDASEIEPIDSGAFAVYLNVRDRKARGKAFVEALNELGDWLQIQLALISAPKFEFDSLNHHRIKTTLRFASVAITSKDVSKLWKSKEQFISVVSRWERVRITGGSESGKSPLAELIVGAWQNTGRQMDVKLAFPLEGSSKNHWTIPVTHSTVYSAVRDASKTLSKKIKTNEVYVLDEVDTALSDNGKALASDIKELIKTGSHYRLGLILIGQNANAKNYQGFDRSDFENLVNVHIGANAYHAIENSNLSEDEKRKLKEKADKLTAYVEKENLEVDASDATRFALVMEPGKQPYFIELPRFGSIPYLQTPTLVEELTLLPELSEALKCPICGSHNVKKNGKDSKGVQRYKCDNGHNFKQ